MAHDPGVGQEPLDVGRAEAGERLGLEMRESAAEMLALPQDGEPGQAGLEALEAELLEEIAVVGRGPAPLLVVVGTIERVAPVPGAAQAPIGAKRQPVQELGPTGQFCSKRRPLLSSTSTAIVAGAVGRNEKVTAGSSESEMSPSTSSTGLSP